MEGLQLPNGESDEGVAVAQGVVQERERVFLGEGGEPQREFGEVDGFGVSVYAVETALDDEPPSKDGFVLIRRMSGVMSWARQAR